MADDKPPNPPAFPCLHTADGMTLRQYYMAHAPEAPLWFEPVMETQAPEYNSSNREEAVKWSTERAMQRVFQWPAAWADEMLKQGEI